MPCQSTNPIPRADSNRPRSRPFRLWRAMAGNRLARGPSHFGTEDSPQRPRTEQETRTQFRLQAFVRQPPPLGAHLSGYTRNLLATGRFRWSSRRDMITCIGHSDCPRHDFPQQPAVEPTDRALPAETPKFQSFRDTL